MTNQKKQCKHCKSEISKGIFCNDDCKKEYRRKYKSDWQRKKDKETNYAYKKKWRKKNRAKLSAYMRKYRKRKKTM